jgi:hypothetical protein
LLRFARNDSGVALDCFASPAMTVALPWIASLRPQWQPLIFTVKNHKKSQKPIFVFVDNPSYLRYKRKVHGTERERASR